MRDHADLTLRCPTCGRRADMCFSHGSEWKKREQLSRQMDATTRESAHNNKLRAELRETRAALDRVLANEGNHYDRYWTPEPEPLTDEYLVETEAKMREALTDAFCDDAAAVMLTLIAEIRRNREAMSFVARFVRSAFVDTEEAHVEPGWVDDVLAALTRSGQQT